MSQSPKSAHATASTRRRRSSAGVAPAAPMPTDKTPPATSPLLSTVTAMPLWRSSCALACLMAVAVTLMQAGSTMTAARAENPVGMSGTPMFAKMSRAGAAPALLASSMADSGAAPAALVGSGQGGMEMDAGARSVGATSVNGGASPQAPMIMRDGWLSANAPSVAQVWQEVLTAVQATPIGATVVSSNMNREERLAHRWKEATGVVIDGFTTVSAHLRMPAEQYDATVAAVTDAVQRAQGKVIGHSTSTQDVTTQYMDAVAWERVEASALERLQSLMQRASSVSEVLSVQEAMNQAQRQLDSAQGQRKYYESRTATSTLHVTLTWPEPPATGPEPQPSWSPWHTLKMALRHLGQLLRWGADMLIYAAIFLLPAVAIMAVLRMAAATLMPRAVASGNTAHSGRMP